MKKTAGLIILCIAFALALTSGTVYFSRLEKTAAKEALAVQTVTDRQPETDRALLLKKALEEPAGIPAAQESPQQLIKEEPEMVLYKGPITHIFFHPLIVYTEKAFDADSLSEGYNEWFVTVREFEKIIESIYSKGYMLVDFSQLYDISRQDGKTEITKKKLMLPAGKKPLIISIDDLNYYDYMRNNGNAHKLVLDGAGNTAAYSVAPDGTSRIDDDSEIVPILDRFVSEHPDFSLGGVKGMIALTGYEGILGYRTDRLDSPDYPKEKAEALKVVNRLKETGWTFACHGYGHLHTGKISFEKLKKDTLRWKAEVEPLIGTVNTYVYPYGEEVQVKDAKFSMLMSEGFNIFCAVGNTGFHQVSKAYVRMDRMNIDGTAFFYRKEKLAEMFDVDSIMDAARPPIQLTEK